MAAGAVVARWKLPFSTRWANPARARCLPSQLVKPPAGAVALAARSWKLVRSSAMNEV